jgi:hypothetical protein
MKKTEITAEEIKKWAAKVHRDARRAPNFECNTTGTWNSVAELAQTVWEARERQSGIKVLVELAVDVLMMELETKGLPVKPRSMYRKNIEACFLNPECFWEEKPFLHLVGELSWLVERAKEETKDVADFLHELTDSAIVLGLPFRGHYTQGVSILFHRFRKP